MKRKLLIALFLLSASIKIYAIKDSLLVFKVGIGASYNLTFFDGNFHQVRYSHYSHYEQTIADIDTINFSPEIKFEVQSWLHKNFGISLGLSYHNSKMGYTLKQINSYSAPPPYQGSYNKSKTDYTIFSHDIILSVGPSFCIQHFYINPNFNLSYFNFHITSFDTPSNKSTSEYDDEFECGAGLNLGYSFAIKKIKPFVELQAEFTPWTSYYQKNLINSGIVLGISF